MAEQTGIKYNDRTEQWDKNMIARMLDDKRYWNDDGFPPIVSKEIGSAITTLRKQRATYQCPIQFIKKKLVCCICGENLNRNGKNAPRIRWDCPKCGWYLDSITDNELQQAVAEKLIDICRKPQKVELEQSANNSLPIQVVRLTNEINQLLDQRAVDANHVLSLILECAAEKYKVCNIRKSDHLTIKLKTLFQEHDNDEKLNRELFEQTVKQVIPQPDGTVQLRLLNGKVV